MADRRQTPDVLGEILGDLAAAPVAQPPTTPRPLTEPVVSRTNTARRSQASRGPAVQADGRPGAKAPAQEPAQPIKWEYLIVSFQEHNGWRPRFANGEELEDWTKLPVIHDYANLLGDAGWELAGAANGKLYGLMDSKQLCFKREKPAA
jgi:hypothetical protein